jgi:hypothetical protein
VDVAGKAEAKTTGEPERAQIEVTTWEFRVSCSIRFRRLVRAS